MTVAHAAVLWWRAGVWREPGADPGARQPQDAPPNLPQPDSRRALTKDLRGRARSLLAASSGRSDRL